MLHVGERAEAPDSPSTSNSSNDEYAELPADQAEYASGSEPSMPGKMMCFSDEMCSFTPEILERPPLKNRERAFQPTIRAPIARANHESMHEGEEEAAIMNRPRASKSSVELLRRSATFEPNFQARMRQSLVQNRRKKEQIRLSVCEKEAECIKATPTINRVGFMLILHVAFHAMKTTLCGFFVSLSEYLALKADIPECVSFDGMELRKGE